MEGCAEGGEVVKWMDGFALGGVWAVGRWGLIVRGVGWDEFFCFLFFFFSAGLKWILWAVDDVVEVVGL